MRWIVLLILLAAAGGIALLLQEGDGPGTRQTQRERGQDPNRKGVVEKPPGLEPLPGVEAPAEFVAACRGRGEEAVPLLLRKLRLDPDRKLQPRWVFEKGVLKGYPTLRSVYIAALAAIPGESATNALQELMRGTQSVQESYQIAIALAERDREGWAGDLLDRAGKGTPADQRLRMEMASFAAKKDPGGTAARIVETAPRGESTDDGRILATAVTALPADVAIATAGRVFDDEQITYRAKGALVRTVLRLRPEMSVYRAMEESILTNRMDDKLKIEAAHAAANSIWFVNDRNEYQLAVAANDGAGADKIRRRFEDRMRAAESLIRAALGANDAKRTKSILAVLEAHKKRFEKK